MPMEHSKYVPMEHSKHTPMEHSKYTPMKHFLHFLQSKTTEMNIERQQK